MAALGELERSVMDLLWDHRDALTANAVRDLLAQSDDARGLAVTTVLTVLARLEKKGLVNRERGTRPHLYRPTDSREDHTVGLIEDALGTANDREAVLMRFAGALSADDADALRRVLLARENTDGLPAA